MRDKLFINNRIYRIVSPLLSGALIYLLILMVFDSLDQLGENFFSQEVLFTIVLSYCLSESFVLMVRMLDRHLPFNKGFRLRQGIQWLLTLVITAIVVTLLVAGYFIIIIGYSRFAAEWMAFNLVFILYYGMINVYYLSHNNLFRHQSMILEKEQQLKINLDLELENFKNDIHPTLLFRCLETLIGLIGLDKKEADDYIMVLSRQYRNILDNKKSELLELDKEMESLSDLLYLLNIRYRQSLCLKNTFREAALAGFLVPGTLAFLAEEIIFNTIINENQPLDLAIDADGPDTLTMAYRPNPVLEGEHYNTGKMQMMNDTYHYFSGRDITKAESGGMIKYYIPILSLTDESSYH
jgi:two-component system LytT family sensor kinase